MAMRGGARSARIRALARTATVGTLVAATVGLGAGTAGGAPQRAAQTDPAAPTSLTVTPSTGLTDGDRVDVTVDGSTELLWIFQCEGGVPEGASVPEMLDSCGSEWAVVPGPRPVTEPFTVRHRFQTGTGRYVNCDDARGCAIGASGQSGEGVITVPIEVAPGPPTLQVSPNWGLTDGQTVGVRAAPLPLSYSGPPFWIFPETGNWTLAQCVAPLAAEPSILDVFTQCASVPGGAVTIDDPYADLGAITVTASITPTLGEATSCVPEGCALAVVRLEAGGAVTAYSTPLAFA